MGRLNNPGHFHRFESPAIKMIFVVRQMKEEKLITSKPSTGKNNGFPILDILGYLKNIHKNPKFGRVRQIPIWELGWEFPDWDLSHSPKFGIFVGIL